MIITLTVGQENAIGKLVEVQARGEAKDKDALALGLLDSVIRGRVVAAAKGSKENDGKAYDAAVAMGFAPPCSKGEFISKRQIEWSGILGDLGMELKGGEWKRVKSEEEDAE
jgi:hypothetical protein